jgi:hypothetical protein
MNKLFNFIAWLSIISALGIVGLVIFWMLYPYKPIMFKDNTFPVFVKTVKQGSFAYYTTNYCKYMKIPALVTREFANDLIFVTPTTVSNREMGCHTINIAVLIPAELPPGVYVMRQRYEYEVNPIRKITIIKDTESFKVVEATPISNKVN